MRSVRVVVLFVIVFGWVVAAGSLVTSIVDPSSLPGFLQNLLGLWPDPGTPASWAVRFGSIGLVIAGVVVFRLLGKMLARREAAQDAATRAIPTAKER